MLNPRGWQQLAALGMPVGILFMLVAAGFVLAGMGWFRRRLWGWMLGTVIIAVQFLAVQFLADVISFLRGEFVRGVVGFVIAGALLIYLLRPDIRACFEIHGSPLTSLSRIVYHEANA